MDEPQRESVARSVLDRAGADCEAIVFASRRALTRFTHNAIHQNLANADATVRIRVIDDGRSGVAETNDLSVPSLEATVARARAIAGLAPRDATRAPLARNTAPAADPRSFARATAEATPELRARLTASIVAPSEAAQLWAAGYVSTAHEGITIANTAGTLVSFDGSEAALNVKANGPDASGYAEQFGIDVDALDASNRGTIAANKCRDGATPVAVDPGPWTVVLEPAAVGELLAYLIDHFSAQSVDEGSSFLCDGLDRSYAGEGFTLRDDHAHRLHAGMPFDYEGFPRERVTLVERGVARAFVTDATWAGKIGRPNTGHGLPAPSARGPIPLHLVVDPGTTSVEELIAQTKRGLLVTRFWYIRPVDARKTIVTGMTRDGTFLIEDGRVVRGVRNMRFNQSILGALRNVEFSDDARRTGGYGYSIVTPAAKIERFTFSSVTAF